MDGQNDEKFLTWNPEAKCMVCTWLKRKWVELGRHTKIETMGLNTLLPFKQISHFICYCNDPDFIISCHHLFITRTPGKNSFHEKREKLLSCFLVLWNLILESVICENNISNNLLKRSKTF